MDSELKIPAYTSVQDIAFDNEGTIWLATNRGLGRLRMEFLNFLTKLMVLSEQMEIVM